MGAPELVLLLFERKHGLSTEQFPVSAYVGSSKNLKNLKDAERNVRLLLLDLFDARHQLIGDELPMSPSDRILSPSDRILSPCD